MRYPNMSFLRETNICVIRTFVILFLSCATLQINPCSSCIPFSLKRLAIQGNLSFDNTQNADKDFGNQCSFLPLAVLHPKSTSDISTVIKYIWEMGGGSDLTVAARGHGHSLHGQAMAHQGIVVNMESLHGTDMQVVYHGSLPYIDVSAGELWINIVHESLKYGMAPKSYTDYLHLTVGGTLSNAGISGQTFKHGPQISNVHQLQVITGRGDVVNCSEKQNTDLFHSVLGGLGQFGVITRAQISLEPAPAMVKWIRVLYTDFTTFSRDQELLISLENTFDYVEGLVIINRTGVLNNWRSSFDAQDPVQASQFKSDGKTLFCLEMTKNFNPGEIDNIKQDVQGLLSKLSYIPSTLFISQVPYLDFLDRVHLSEIKLSSKGLWDVPHPWLNLLIPKSKIMYFADEVFGNILTDTSNGPILIYPVTKSRWDNRTSAVIPEEDVFYLVAFLSSAIPSSTGTDGLDFILTQNTRILNYCKNARLGVKQYLPHYTTQEDWKAHFGLQWEAFARRKSIYDPLAILAPGQRIFPKALSTL